MTETEIVIVTVTETGIVTAAETAIMTVMAVRAITIHVLNRVLMPDHLIIPAADVTINNKRQYGVALSFWLTERKGNVKLILGTGLSYTAGRFVFSRCSPQTMESRV